MTVIDSGTRFGAPAFAPSWFRFKRLLVRFRQQRRAVRAHIMMSRLDDRLLYDIGLDPLDLHEALKTRQPPAMLADAVRKQMALRNGRQD